MENGGCGSEPREGRKRLVTDSQLPTAARAGGTGTQVALAATGGDLSFAVPGKDAAAQLPCHPPRIDHGISLRTINLNR